MMQLKVAIIGAGFIGRQHAEALRRIPGIQIAAVADFNPLVKEWAEENDIPIYYQDYREMLENGGFDVIHDCAPNHMHYTINKAAILKGYHVYSEKPLTLSSAEAEELARLSEERQIVAGVNFNYRNNVMVHEMKGRMQAGKLGTLSHIQGEYLQDWLLYDTDFDWRIQKETGGNSRAVGDIGSHCFDAVQYVTGQKIKAVYAQYFKMYPVRKKYRNSGTFSEARKGEDYEEIEVETEDAATILFRLEAGMTGTLIISQVCAGKKNGMKLCISGSQEAVEWEQERPDRLIIGKRSGGNELLYADSKYLTDYAKKRAVLPNGHPTGWTDALANSFREFYEAVRNSGRCCRYADFKDGYYIAKIVEACYESNQKKCWIDIK